MIVGTMVKEITIHLVGDSFTGLYSHWITSISQQRPVPRGLGKNIKIKMRSSRHNVLVKKRQKVYWKRPASGCGPSLPNHDHDIFSEDMFKLISTGRAIKTCVLMYIVGSWSRICTQNEWVNNYLDFFLRLLLL